MTWYIAINGLAWSVLANELFALQPWLTRALGLSRASAYRYAAAGELPVQRFGGRVYVITAKIRHLIDGSEEAAA